MRGARRNSGSTAALSPTQHEASQDARANRRVREPSPRSNRTLKNVNGDSPRETSQGLEAQLNALAAAPPAERQGSLRGLLKQTQGAPGKPPSRGNSAKKLIENNPSPPESRRTAVRSGSAGSQRQAVAETPGRRVREQEKNILQVAATGDESFSSSKTGSTSGPVPDKVADDELEFDDGRSTPITSDMLDRALEDGNAPSLNKLTVLTLSALHICDIRGLNGCQSLRHLDLSFNRIKNIFGLEGLIQLRELRLTCNKISRLDGLQKLTALEELHVQVNRISEVGKGALANCRKLRSLRIDGNHLDALVPHTERLAAMTSLDASSNRLTSIQGLTTMAQMEELNMSYNGIASLEGMGAFGRLQELNLVSNQLESLAGLRGCGQLRVLRVNDNRISDLKGLQRVPLLEELYAAGNQLTHCGELVSTACPHLEFLDVSRNSMSDLNEVERVGGLSCLIDLKLAGNPLCLNELFPQRARQFLSGVDTLDDEDFRSVRIRAQEEEEKEREGEEGGEGTKKPEAGEVATGAVLDRGGVTVDKHRKHKELAEVLSVEEFEAQIRGMQTGIQSVKQSLQQQMYHAMYPPEDKQGKRPSELAEEAIAKQKAAHAARALKEAGEEGGRRGRRGAGGERAGKRLEPSERVKELYERGNQLVAKALQRVGKTTWDAGGPSREETQPAAREGGGDRGGYLQSERLAGREMRVSGGEDSRESTEMHEAVARFNSELNKRLAATNQELLREVALDDQDQLSPALQPPRSPVAFPLKDQRRAEAARMKQEMDDLRAGRTKEGDGDGMHDVRSSAVLGVAGAKGRRVSEGEALAAAPKGEEEAKLRPASSRPHASGGGAEENEAAAKPAVPEEKGRVRYAEAESSDGADATREGEGGVEAGEVTEGWQDEFYADSRPSTSGSRLRDDGAGSRPGSSRVRERLSEARQLAATVAQSDV